VTAKTTVLSLAGVAKNYGEVRALRSVDLAVHAGELLTLLGPSGSGKTTLLKVIAGFEIADAGVVTLGGHDITTLPPNKRNIGMVFQNYALFPHMTVAENIAFPLSIRKVPRAQATRDVEEALALVGLAGYGRRFPKQLSGGQQQRVALARAVVFEPRLLLLDEPFGALDRKLREQMQLEVRRLQQRLGITTIFVTHDQEEALVLSDRIAVMSDGVIEQLGDPRAIYAAPVNRFVADFIGESNLMHARVNSGGDAAVLDNGTALPLPAALPAGTEVGVLLRPESISIRAQDAPDGFPGCVEDVVYLGSTLKYFLRLDNGLPLLVRGTYSNTVAVPGRGDRVRAAWSASDLQVVRW
jgi:putative spermidine/putrescine transport system ATP-binding protein